MPRVPPDSRAPERAPSRRSHLLPLAVLLGSLVIFAALSVASWTLYDQAEQRLLEESTGEAAQVLTVAVSSITAPLDSAATIAQVTDGDAEAFRAAMADQVGPPPSRFTAAALFRIGDDAPLATIGDALGLSAGSAAAIADVTAAATAADDFAVIDLMSGDRRLGYATVDAAESPLFVVYAERQLNPDPNVRTRTDEPFARLDYAIYLTDERPEQLITSSLPNGDLPIEGRRASVESPFGDQQLVLVTTPIGHLTSWVFANLWWIIAVVGLLVSLGAAWLTRSLSKRREEALALADDNARLYDEQRHIAETLQLSLLPQVLVPPPGGQVTARYWPAGEASLIGGDFYDAFRVDADRWGVVIGDVCGKGIDAAAITGLVRHTVRAAARNATSPSEVLRDVHRALSDHEPSTFCTVCFLYVQIAEDGSQSLDLALGGHPAPIVRRAAGSVEEVGVAGSLLGIFEPMLVDTVISVAPGDTLVLYTDGLTDAPPNQAVPIEELLELLAGDAGDDPVEMLADEIRPLKRRRRPRGSADDTAVVIVRFGVPADSDEWAPHEGVENSVSV